MRLVTPHALRELATQIRAKLPTLGILCDTLNQVADELESRDAEIEGLKRALESVRR